MWFGRYGGNDIDGLDMSQNGVRMLKMVEKCDKQDGGRSSLTPIVKEDGQNDNNHDDDGDDDNDNTI